MPQPHPTGNQPTSESSQSSNTQASTERSSSQPKPPSLPPKQQWIDPRITEAIKSIDEITLQAEELGQQADSLQVTSKDRVFLTIEEQLTKLLLKLDSIDSLGDDGVRSKRKACIQKVQQTLDALELKLLVAG